MITLLNKIERQKCFVFKAGSYPCTVIKLLEYNFDEMIQEIPSEVARFPKFFENIPVIIDIEKLQSDSINFEQLKQLLEKNGMVVIGIQNGSESQQRAARDVGLASFNARNKTQWVEKPASKPTMIVSHPIRSGMQIFAKETDLIITSQVSPGAEIMADGNIHVYGALRGRALAGVSGNQNSQIFCRELEAELIAIAGYYMTKEEMSRVVTEDPLLLKPKSIVQIALEHEQIQIRTF